MNIPDNTHRDTITNASQIRSVLHHHAYSNKYGIQMLQDIITRYIDCSYCEYNEQTFIFQIKVKKSFINKLPDKRHESSSYYNVISAIFAEYIQSLKASIISGLGEMYSDPVEVYRDIVQRPMLFLANLCQIICVGDSMLYIKL